MNAWKLIMLITFSCCAITASAQKEIKGKGIRMDLPKVAPSALDKDSSNLKKNPDPLNNTIVNNHNKDIKAFVSGKLYVMTGLVAGQSDSLIFEQFAFTEHFQLNAMQLREIGKRFSDKSNFPKRSYQMLCAFAPNIGLELTTLDGKTEKYLLAYDCSELAQSGKKGKINYQNFDMAQMRWFSNLETSLVFARKNKYQKFKLKTCQPDSLLDGEGRMYGSETLGVFKCTNNH